MNELTTHPDLTNPAFMEHRWGVRIPTQLDIGIYCFKQPLGRGLMTDISVGGAYVETRVPLKLMNAVTLVVLPGATASGTEVRLAGYVSRTARGGIGVAWTDFAPDAARGLILALLEQPAGADHPTAPRPV